MKQTRLILWVCVVFAGLVAIGYTLIHSENTQQRPVVITPAAGFNQGSPFTLTSHDGTSFNSADRIQNGHYALMFFGFTHCPVICPTELQKMATVMDMLDKDAAAKTTPIFITIDPERDTVESLQAYIPQFHPAIIGLTGNVADVHRVLNEWKVYFNKVETPEYSDYTMDHSTYAYLVDSNMTIIALFTIDATAKDIAKKITSVTEGH